MIEVNKVSKRYNKDFLVVKEISFSVNEGEIFGLLGPNGAGKTTLMQMMATLLKPTSGDITIEGFNTVTEAQSIKKIIGFLTTEIKLDPMSTPNNLFDFFGELYDIEPEEILRRKQESFTRFGITPFADKRIVELSTGMKQKVSIVISLIHNPKIIIFDEPTNGLDILTQRQVMDYLIELKNEGKSVILSTHIFSVADELCDRTAVMVDGRIVAIGTSDELIASTNSKNFEGAFFKLYSDNHKEDKG
ncbi:MAG: ABC transporter ATP-binding protein [Clostridia bacterium]|nr:ABC transporter ATP-binding protein [Clostridia bacterium]